MNATPQPDCETPADPALRVDAAPALTEAGLSLLETADAEQARDARRATEQTALMHLHLQADELSAILDYDQLSAATRRFLDATFDAVAALRKNATTMKHAELRALMPLAAQLWHASHRALWP